jgi:benzoylformate decarboxylase
MGSMSSTVRDSVIALLRSFGMTTIFGNPGSTELPFFRDLPDDFRYVLGLQECVAVGMADGYAQATRNAALVNLHSSVGVGHALGNIFTSFRNQTPLVITAGQQARSILSYEPFLFAQNATEFPRPFVKWACEPARAQDVPSAIARAYYVSMQPPCGPTFVSIPVDDWDRACEPIERRQISVRIQGDPDLLDDLAKALSRAERPAIVVGAGVARDDAWHELIALAERHEAVVWVAPMAGRNSFPEDHRLFAGFLAAMREKIVGALQGHDLILVIGGALSLYHVEGFGPHVPAGSLVYQIVDNHALASSAPTGTSIIANAKLALQWLLRGPAPMVRKAPAPRAPPPPLPASRLSDAYLCQRIARLRPSASIIVEEAPSTRGAMHEYLPIVLPDGFYTCASGGLGYGLPAAIGVALGRPQEKVIVLLGDGSSMYAIQGLWSAAQLKLPVSFVVAKNGTYQALIEFGGLFGLREAVGTRLPDIDFCALARGQGIDAVRVESCGALDEALRASFSAPRPNLVEVVVP